MNTILKYPGSKWRIAKWIIGHFPDDYENMTYLEPFFGSGSIFFTKDRSRIETINDIDDNVVNLFKIIRDRPHELAYQISMTPWSRKEYHESYIQSNDDLESARRFLVRMWMAIGAKTSDKTGWRNNISAENYTVQGFHTTLPENILVVCERLRNIKSGVVQIENQDVFKLIERYNRSDVLMYLDPPYVMNTRHGRIYKYEFTEEKHIELLNHCNRSKAKILISGYDNKLYDSYLSNWHKDTIIAECESGQKRTEVIWMNYVQVNKQMSFDDVEGE